MGTDAAHRARICLNALAAVPQSHGRAFLGAAPQP